MEQERLARLICQHAETSRLMGVDFVPAFARDDDSEGPKSPDPAPPVAPLAPGRATQTIELKERAAPLPANAGREAKQAALDDLRARYERDAPHKDFVTAFNNIVFGDGDPCARLVFIGEAPGEEEDKTGKPFVGRAGQLLTKMIGAMGLTREQVYICNVLKTRPLNNATPTPREIELCSPYLAEQIGIIDPAVIVTLGLPAAKAVLKTEGSMGNLRGRWASMHLGEGRKIAVMPTYHPAFLLRSYTPENRAKVWADLQLAMERLGMTPSSEPAA